MMSNMDTQTGFHTSENAIERNDAAVPAAGGSRGKAFFAGSQAGGQQVMPPSPAQGGGDIFCTVQQ